jgi:hypothetical protein
MAVNTDFGRRLRDAKRSWEQTHDKRLVWRVLGEELGAAMSRETYAPNVVRRWFMQGIEPENFIATVSALADFLEVSPGWLAFAEEPHIIRRGMLPTPGEDFENRTGMPKQKKTEARRQKKA